MGAVDEELALPCTGERLSPSTEGDVAIEHLHRYAVAEHLAEGLVVLDVACGEGYGSALLARRAARVIGVDRDAEAVAHAARTYRGPNLSFRVGSAAALPAGERSVDLVVSFETIEHLAEHEAMLDEIRRVLRPGGRLLISTPDRSVYTELHARDNPHHVRELSAEELRGLLGSRFGHVSMFRQRLIRGSLMVPDGGGPPAGFRSYRGGFDQVSGRDGLAEAVYLVALASDEPISDGLASSFEGRGVRLDVEVELGDLRSRVDRMGRALSVLKDQLREVIVDRDRAVRDLEDCRATLDRATVERDGLREQLRRAQADGRRLRERLRRAEDDRAALGGRLDRAEAERLRLVGRLHRIDRDRARIEARRVAAAEETDRLHAALDAARREAQAVRDALQHQASVAGADREATALLLAEARAEADRLRDALHELVASRFWRYSRPIRAVGPAARKTRAGLARASLATARRLPGPVRETLRGLKRRIEAAREDRRALEALARSGLAFPATDRPTVSIVIPVHNHYRETIACLRSIRDYVAGVDYEVIVVDDASTDPTPRALALVPGVVAVRNAANLGFIGSCNAGAARARGEFLAFLNNDTVVSPGWLEELVRTLREEPGAGLVGSRLVYPDGRLQEAGGIIWRDADGWNFGRGGDPDDPEYSYARDCDYCSGASILIRRELFAELGGFDSRFAPAYYEDTDLAFQVRRRGLRVIYQPLSVVVHFEGLSSGTDTSTGVKAYQVTNRRKFHEKWADELALHPPGDAGDPYLRVAPQNRVLVIDHVVPTPDQDSGSLRMFRILQILRRRGLAVTFIPDNLHATPGYTRDLQRIGVKVPHHPYISSVRDYLERHGHRYALAWVCRPDIVARHLEDIRLLAPQAKVAFDTVDLHFVREGREAAMLGDPDRLAAAEARKAQELALAEASDYTLVVSRAEAEILRGLRPGLDLRIVSNVHEAHGEIPGYADRSGIVFIGGFNHPPNVDAVEFFVRDVFPEVRRRLPGVTFTVIGSHPPDRIRSLACDDVIVAGFVPDVTDHFRRCRLSVAPLRYGAGVKGKVNMSLAFGVPAVVTPIAAEGMHLVDGRDALIAEEPVAFAEAIVRAYRDPILWRTLSENGLRNIEEHFSTEVVAREIDGILADAGLAAPAHPPLRLVGPDDPARARSRRAS